MDILSNLSPAAGSTKNRKRVGRGQGSGHGATATRGNKGHSSRSGSTTRRSNEGGQMPLTRRVPKFGFTPPHRVEFQVVNVGTLQKLADAGRLAGDVTPASLRAAGAVSSSSSPVKVLGEGTITAKLRVTAAKFSKSAALKITAAGGEAVTA